MRIFNLSCLLNVFLCFSSAILAQTDKIQALNNYQKFSNESINYVTRMMKCLKVYHDDISNYKSRLGKKGAPPQLRYYTTYQCSKQLEDYYYKEAFKGDLRELNNKALDVWQVLEKLDKQCKDLEIYLRLEEYKTDNLVKSDKLIADFPALFHEFQTSVEIYDSAIRKHYQTSGAHKVGANFQVAENQMLTILDKQVQVLKAWNFNFNEEIGTGWVTDLIQKTIAENDEILRKAQKSTLPYPANSMQDSFMEGLRNIQELLRTGIDEYNLEAQKTDKHSNEVYSQLLNYYNNLLVSNFNTFVEMSRQAGQSLVYTVQYAPLFELKTAEKQVKVTVKPFQDKPHLDFSVNKVNTPIDKNAFLALQNYLDFINEALHENRRLIPTLRNHNSSTNSLKEGHKYNISYKLEDYKTPKSTYQKTLLESKFLNPTYQKSLNTQLEVLLNIVIEMEQLSADLSDYVNSQKYQTDDLKHSDEVLQRYEVLFETLDEKKEVLYNDVRKIFESYPMPAGSWKKSGKALLSNSDLSKEILFTTKKFFKGNQESKPNTNQITNLENSFKSLIINEYDNMKGIERIGRNNGLCPYNPYEDSPELTKTLVEKTRNFEKIIQSPYERDPYHNYIYLHNELIYQFNKFAELSKIPMLKNINQPELFKVQKPQPKKTTIENPPQEIKKEKKEEDENSPDYLKTMTGYASNNLVFLLDVSASMASPEKLPLLKQSIKHLISIMRPEDKISIVVYSGKAEVTLQGVSSQETQKINEAIDKLKSDGKTNSEDGIKLAYKTADKNFLSAGNNRIVLATDGEFAVSDKVYELVEKNAQKEINLSVFSYGKIEKKYENLQKLSEKGKGNYEHITQENANFKLIKEAKAKKL